jgi:hypothetical protein
MADPIQKLYDYLSAEEATRVTRWRPPSELRFRPSELGGCWRALYYRLQGNQPKPIKAETKLLFLDGDIQHNVMRNMFREAGIELGDLVFEADGGVEETGASKRAIVVPHGGQEFTVLLSGRTDGLIDVDGKMVLLEIKTIGKYKFDQFQYQFAKGGTKAVIRFLRDDVKKRAGARPHPRHGNRRFWFQFQGTMLLREAPQIYIVLKNRDTGEIGLRDPEGGRHGLLIDADPEVQDEILARCAVVLRSLEAGTPPSTEFMDGSTSCNLCDFRHLCWGKVQNEES